MPDPVTIARIGAEVVPFILAAFGGGPERVDPDQVLRSLIDEFNRVLGPAGDQAVSQAARAGAISGAQLRQDVASSVGSIGGGSAGATRVTRGLGQSAATNRAAQGAADARLKVAQTIAALAAEALPSAIQGQTLTRPSTGFQNFLQGLAGVTATDGNPILGLLDRIIGDSEAGELPLSAQDLQKIMTSPLVQPQGPSTRNFGTQGSQLFFGPPPGG